MIKTLYNGEDLWLVNAQPNYAQGGPKLTTSLPFTDVERAISARESRRVFGLSHRHELTYNTTFRDAFSATQFRSGLNSLKTERVGVPLWTDLCVTSASLGATGTAVALDNLPSRWGRAWIFIAPDGFTFEIVLVNSIDTSLRMAARTGLIWPKGSKCYPLLLGRLTERPQLNGSTPSRANAEIRIREKSPLVEQISPMAGAALATVGSRIPEFSTARLWDITADSAEQIDTTEMDVTYKQVGFGREESEYAFPNWNRRGLEMLFNCRSREAIARLERLFTDRMATLKPFFIATPRNDLELAADTVVNQPTILIKPSAYEQPEYDEIPGSGFIALVEQNGAVHPHRVIEVDGTTITTEQNILVSYPAATTRIAFLTLVRLADAQIEWEYVTPSWARAKLKFPEMSDEYVTPNDAQFQDVYFYNFQEFLPNGTVNNWYLTSYEAAITSFGNTYLSAPLTHAGMTRALDLSNSLELISWGGGFPGNPLNRFLPYTLCGDLKITVAKGKPDGTGVRILWSGYVQKLSTKGQDWTAECGLSRRYQRKVPSPLLQSTDNLTIFEPASGVDPEDFKTTGTITAISGKTITITAPNKPNDLFAYGYLDAGAAGAEDARSILSSSAVGTTHTIVVDRPLFYAAVGQSVDFYQGYDGTIEQRDTKFGDRPGFFGHRYRPPSNPAAKGPDLATPMGGKK